MIEEKEKDPHSSKISLTPIYIYVYIVGLENVTRIIFNPFRLYPLED